jgi:two-component system KDP operon response regulator KdpE
MSNKKILVVEDDADVRLGYRVLLRAHGYDTFFAADSVAAVSEARKQQPDVILLDLGLPAGDGFIVLERFRSNTLLGMIPVIVVSARDPHQNKERALKAGARAYLQKPWNDNELLGTIRSLLEESAPAPAAAPQRP